MECGRGADRALSLLPRFPSPQRKSARGEAILTHVQIGVLTRSVARDPSASAALIADIALHWDRMPADARQRMLNAVAWNADAARRALGAPHAAAGADDSIHALAQAVFSHVAWDALDAIPLERRAALLRPLLAATLGAPHTPDAVAAAHRA